MGITHAAHADPITATDYEAAHDISALALTEIGLKSARYPVGLVDEWNDEATASPSGILSEPLTNVTRLATGGPASEPALQTAAGGGPNRIGTWSFDPGDVVQVEVDVKTVAGGGSFLKVTTDAGTWNLNDDANASYAHKRAVFTIGATGLFQLTSTFEVHFANLFIYKIARYPVLTAWYAGDADTTLDNGETWGGGSSRDATGGRKGTSMMKTGTGGGPTTILTLSGLVNGQVYRLECWGYPQAGGGTFLKAVVNAGTFNITSDANVYWRRYFIDVTVGASLDIAIRNTFEQHFDDFIVTQIGS